MMWPFNKTNKKKGVTLAPGESLELGLLTQWRGDKDEVIVVTNDGPVLLDGKNQLFVRVEASNMDPVTLQIVPDFKNRVLNFIEIIDPNVPKKFTDANGPRLIFAESTKKSISFGDYLKEWDSNIEEIGKIVSRFRLTRNIFVPIMTFLTFYNLYLFITSTNTVRYVNLATGLFSLCVAYYMWNSYKKYHNNFKKYKEMRNSAFGVVKDK